jgi:hypothetical protein
VGDKITMESECDRLGSTSIRASADLHRENIIVLVNDLEKCKRRNICERTAYQIRCISMEGRA